MENQIVKFIFVFLATGVKWCQFKDEDLFPFEVLDWKVEIEKQHFKEGSQRLPWRC
jgi:hypothetical protein